MFGTMHYIVASIDGDYAHLKRTDVEENELKLVARALLPDGIAEGTKLVYEMLQYEIEQQIVKFHVEKGDVCMIYVTGDTHTDWMSRLNMESFPEQREMTKDDYVIILGDFGIWDNSKREKYALNWLDTRSFTTLFVSGNHENYDMLDEMPVSEWHGGKVNFIRPSVIHLRRGQIFEIAGKTFFAFGGASSHDIQDGILDPTDPEFKKKKKLLDKDPYSLYRVKGKSWWEQELPSEEEMTEGIQNLEKYGNKVDYILTHCPYNSVLSQMESMDGTHQFDRLTDYLQGIREKVGFGHWLFGHMHVNQMFREERAVCLYEQIVRIG